MCVVSFTPCVDSKNKWVLGNLFNRAYFQIYEVKTRYSRIGFLNNYSRLLTPIVLSDTSGGSIIWILLAVTLSAIASMICCICLFRACSLEKKIINVKVNQPPKKVPTPPVTIQKVTIDGLVLDEDIPPRDPDYC